MSTKLTLDGKALGMLIEMLGDDFVLEIRNCVLKEVAKKYLSVKDTELGLAVEQTCKDLFTDQFGEWVPNNRSIYGSKRFQLKKDVTDVIESQARLAVEDYIFRDDKGIQAVLMEAVEYKAKYLERKVLDSINDKMNRAIFNKANDYIESEVERRLRAQMKMLKEASA